MRIVYWARMALARQQIIERVGSLPGVTLQLTQSLEETLAALPGATGLLLVHGPQEEARQIKAALSAPDNTVRWMHFVSAGREGYEEIGWPPGVTVTYAGGGVAPTVAEHAMALLLALARRIPELVSTVMPQKAFDRTLVAPKARTLEGATLAVIGFGYIGQEVARRAKAFGMKVVAVSRSPASGPDVDEALPLSRLHEALVRADAVVVSIALTPETTYLLGDPEFQLCKPGVLLVNVARGPIVNTDALARALREGRVGGAGLDVTDPEPLPPDHPLWDCPNVLISPHYAGAGSGASVERLADGVLENLQRLRSGKPLLCVVSEG